MPRACSRSFFSFLCAAYGICGPFVFETMEFHRTMKNRSRRDCYKQTMEMCSAGVYSDPDFWQEFGRRAEHLCRQLLAVTYEI